jgi:uncharacterized Zn finger protein
MTKPICPQCGKSEYFKYRQIQHEADLKMPRDLVAMVYCTNCGKIIGIGAGR